MLVVFPVAQCIGKDEFQSKKGTRCGVLRWYDQTEGKVFKVMCFGDDVDKLKGLEQGMQCSVYLEVAPSRRDDSIELVLDHIDSPQL